MPFSPAVPRREVHRRIIDMKVYARDDGLFDVEAHLVDTKPFDFTRIAAAHAVPAGSPLHDLWVRLTVDQDFVVRAIEAQTDATPYALCHEAGAALGVLVGERLVRGWTARVKERLRGADRCTHLAEMLIPAASAALQGIRGTRSKEARHGGASGQPPWQIDTCYAFGRDREVVRMLWPEHHRPRDA